MNKDRIPNQVPHEHQGKSIRQLLEVLQPYETYVLMHPANDEVLVCQLARSQDGKTYYIAGPQFNGDEVINLAILMESNMIADYNKLHSDPEHQIYEASSPLEAGSTLQMLFHLNKINAGLN